MQWNVISLYSSKRRSTEGQSMEITARNETLWAFSLKFQRPFYHVQLTNKSHFDLHDLPCIMQYLFMAYSTVATLVTNVGLLTARVNNKSLNIVHEVSRNKISTYNIRAWTF